MTDYTSDEYGEKLKDYFDKTKMFRQKGDIYISQIIDEEMEANDERLQRNVS